MTNKQQSYKKSLIQKIQIAKHNVFIDDEVRKEFMLSRFGVDSTTKLSIDELKLLLDFCNRNVSDIPFSKPTEAQLKKIYDTWYLKAKDKSQNALNSFVSKIVKKEMITLTKNDATKVIVALENMR
ncbi:phage protein GemA/Gp16 family protein [Arcobacter aquimarinus]|uniref:DUF1018 domain-containing protein n=1 Tax=Arcobacter aquimarinus TaxID=1315211 RepID=A0AAE7B371_9BACT|nr:phage protein GemA/Gp16 family protein [Arcobacter aquimarinus]QKE26191.1 DUF1018 domain-containing protein [Arcobacter aquimarinus]RXI35809.1 hypothetical protein CP986_05355 [Arcobacter aquimarinus]